MKGNLNAFALGVSSAIVAALSMLVLGIFGNLGIYMGAVKMMGQWHMFFNLTFTGIVSGMIEAGLITFITLYLVGIIYNKLAE